MFSSSLVCRNGANSIMSIRQSAVAILTGMTLSVR